MRKRAHISSKSGTRPLRSQLWFDNPDNPGMTALYLERYLNYGLTQQGIAFRQADHRHRADGFRSVAVQSASYRIGQTRARRNSNRRRHRVRVPGAPDPGNRKAPDRRARPQPRLSRPRRSAVRLSARRRRAHDRLRQDDPGLSDGGGDRQHAGHRSLRRADAQRLVEGRTRRLRHRNLAGASGNGGRPDRRRGIYRYRRLDRALDRSLQHHGHRLDHECAGRSARHDVAGLRGDPGALSRARADRLRDRRARGRDRARESQAVRHSHPQGVRERHRRQFGDRRLDQRANPHQRHRPPYRREDYRSRTGRRSATTCRCWSTCSRPANIWARNISAPAVCRR